jgi:hypothetical protein
MREEEETVVFMVETLCVRWSVSAASWVSSIVCGDDEDFAAWGGGVGEAVER